MKEWPLTTSTPASCAALPTRARKWERFEAEAGREMDGITHDCGLRDAVAGQSAAQSRQRMTTVSHSTHEILFRTGSFNLSINAHPIRNWFTVRLLRESVLSLVGYFDVVDRFEIL